MLQPLRMRDEPPAEEGGASRSRKARNGRPLEPAEGTPPAGALILAQRDLRHTSDHQNYNKFMLV